ncbi:hypothetical protein [Pseudomonas chlororaphis]|uniref:hypothetical protein n=1 Tax=Pseudomonas chlororaphis TaxID=587753 RepID=UPI0039E1F27C
MTQPFALDTNAYALLFQHPKSQAYYNLEKKIKAGEVLSFFIPEIVAMEIHSVLGKYRRGGVGVQKEACTRNVLHDEKHIPCSNICVTTPRQRMSPKVYKALQKLMKDIEGKSGNIQADLLPLGTTEMSEGKKLLMQLSHRFAFGSHDALVAGTVVAAATTGLKLTLVTSDKSLKAVCNEEGIPFFDPNIESPTENPEKMKAS